jgi:hypothetical protein
MIGVTYKVVPVNGEPWEFKSHMGLELAWERHAAKHGLPILPRRDRAGNLDISTFPMATNAAFLAYSYARPGVPFEEWSAGIASVMPDDTEPEELPDPTLPAVSSA